jgi:hypothetical protein
MADVFEKIIKRMNVLSEKAAEKTGLMFKRAVDVGEEYAYKGKVQVEIEKMKWDLRTMYIDLGKYISHQNRNDDVTDFSHDEKFVLQIDKIEKQCQYIAELEKEKYKSETSGSAIEDDQELKENPTP